ncbi:MAG: 4-alpha-glucanotransferase, partial [Clostridia bacterium]|nr:4-alpha-glucanotransferase [Clostridia bacterium]
LVAEGLLDKEFVKGYEKGGDRIDYGYLFESREFLLKKAFETFDIRAADYIKFKMDNAFWLDDYALFMSIKEYNNNAEWSEWSKEEKFRTNVPALQRKYASSTEFWKFAQYEFYKQFSRLKKYANSKGIKIIGDMPIYVAYDSVDVWSAPDNYLLDEDLVPVSVAGVPPDLFSEDGQLWGNPIYDWKKMKKDKFSWWIDRLKVAYKLYDVIRIDHFRGFAGYYVVDKGEKTAKNGEWRKGVGKAIFDELNRQLSGAEIIAEDLGVITPDVRKLLKYTGYPGMKVLQFAFGDENSDYLPKNIKSSNCVVYTGTHDNMTTPQWIEELSDRERELFIKVCKPKKGEDLCNCLIRTAMSTKADTVIIPMADYMGLGKEARINAPSTTGDNWTWRLGKRYNTAALREKIKTLSKRD